MTGRNTFSLVVRTAGLSVLCSLLFALVLFILERTDVLMVYVQIGGDTISLGESALFLFIMMWIVFIVIEILRKVFKFKVK